MKATSGLSSECLRFLNKPLELTFYTGWGWFIQKEYGNAAVEYPDIDKVNLTTSEVTPTRFYRHHGVLRAFKGFITGQGHTLSGHEAFLFTLSDGFDWDFTNRVEASWGIALGRGEPQFPCRNSPNHWPVIFKNDIIRGFCGNIKEK